MFGDLFTKTVLTASVNAMREPGRRIFQRFFAPVAHMSDTAQISWDVISGSEKVLPNISIYAPATITEKTNRKTITMMAPRIASKRIIHVAELANVRAFGEEFAVEQLKGRIARELMDMRNEADRTLEFWAAYALRGQVYDSDMSTILVDYGLPSGHTVTLSGSSLWSDTTNSDPVGNLRTWKRLIEQDCDTEIRGFVAFVGYSAMDYLLKNTKILDLIKYTGGVQLAENARIVQLAGVTLEEYNASFIDGSATRRYFVPANEVILVGIGDDVFDCPYAPVIDVDGTVGNMVGRRPAMFFSKSWETDDPSGRWIKVETRPIPVLKRPSAIVRATVV